MNPRISPLFQSLCWAVSTARIAARPVSLALPDAGWGPADAATKIAPRRKGRRRQATTGFRLIRHPLTAYVRIRYVDFWGKPWFLVEGATRKCYPPSTWE